MLATIKTIQHFHIFLYEGLFVLRSRNTSTRDKTTILFEEHGFPVTLPNNN